MNTEWKSKVERILIKHQKEIENLKKGGINKFNEILIDFIKLLMAFIGAGGVLGMMDYLHKLPT